MNGSSRNATYSLGSIVQLTEPSGLSDDEQPALPESALAIVGKSTT